jgi:NAD(P)-dependent dehydrogenase (short-subunit alcohol dehydrogenase family)
MTIAYPFPVSGDEFKGKRVLVTGGTKGMGRAMVRRFTLSGASVATTARSPLPEGQAVALFAQTDIGTATGVQEVVSRVQQEWGGLDILVNNVGGSDSPRNHLSGHSRRTVAGRAAQAGLAGSRGEPPGGDGRSASRGTFRPAVGRRARADGAGAAERTRVRPKECGGIYRGGKSKRGLSVCGQMRKQKEGFAVPKRRRMAHL